MGNKERQRRYYLKNKEVFSQRSSEYHLKNKEERNAQARQYRKKNPDKIREASLKKRYGITLAEYDRMLVSQNSGCAICGTKNPGGKGQFHVDHCHKTDAVRGLLCSHCNLGLGHFKDSPELLLKGIEYVNRINGL